MRRPYVFPSLFLVVLLVTALFGCGVSESPPAELEVTIHPDLAAGEHVFTTTDGVELPYVVSGDSEATVVLVHCWMCERSFWDAQIPALQDDYRVIALDLPGHGEGGDGRDNWSIAGYGEDVSGLITHLGLERVVLVGHSMGGPVSLRAAALAGDSVVGIVAVDTLHDADFDFDQPMVVQMFAAFEGDFREVCTDFVNQMFVEEGVDEIVDKVRRVGCEDSNAEAGRALMRDFAALDFPTLFREAGVPIRAINAAGPNATQVETNRKYADFDAVYMEDVGHYLHMTRPEEFNRLLLETLNQML
jgi:pimeloyl-ACP methyl ester carboxylesterase